MKSEIEVKLGTNPNSIQWRGVSGYTPARLALMIELRGKITDPAGEEYEREQLRDLGKWRFVLLRGVIGFGAPLFFLLAYSSVREDIQAAHALHENIAPYLLRHWLFDLLMLACFGCIVGFLAWRRLTSDFWPGREPDPESSQIRLGL